MWLGPCLWKIKNAEFVCGWDHICVRLGESKNTVLVAGTMSKCPLRRGICLWEVKNAESVCGWDHICVRLGEGYA